MSVVNNDDAQTIASFLDAIYRDAAGHCYIACKVPGSQHEFTKHFFNWPDEREKAVAFILERRAEYEVYYAPAVFKNPSGQKKDVSGSYVAWVEFDGNVPGEISGGLPNPTIRVRSSTEDHEHWYWFLDSFVSPYDLERINRGLAYFLSADSSGWDAGQILRPPNTFNHKRQREVELVHYDPTLIPVASFNAIPEPPPPVEAPVPESIPSVEDVIAKYPFSEAAWRLFKKGVPEGKRSEGLMSLGYYLAEMGLPDDALFSVLLNADERWGKFSGRADQHVRLMEIVVRARAKYPVQNKPAAPETTLISIGFRSILTSEVHLEWVWEGFLQEGGYYLLTGHAGVGKTQFSLNAGAAFAVGGDFLGKEIKGQHKVGFFSLEMGMADLQYFMKSQAKGYSNEELETLEENLRFFPLGEPIYLNRKEEKRRIEEVIKREGLTGLIIDSLGSTTEEELTGEKDVKNLMDWNDHLRQEYGVFTWFIHHHRKATGDNKKPNKLADVYGSQYITARATSVMCMWEVPGSINAIELSSLKMRLAPKPPPFTIYRGMDLRFTLEAPKKEKEKPLPVEKKAEVEKPKPATGGFELKGKPGKDMMGV